MMELDIPNNISLLQQIPILVCNTHVVQQEYAMYCGLGASSFTLQVTFDLKHKIWCRGDRQLVPNSTTVCKDSIH